MLKLSDKKATGLDSISTQLIKISAPHIANSITNIFNCAISTGIFPDDRKLARVIPVFKNGSPSDVNNYKPISIIPVIAKVFEKIIYDQLYNYLSVNNLLSNCQSGFRALHSTVTSLLNITDNWRFNIDKGQINGVVFVDLKKAFDTVDHSVLISKFERYGLNELALRLFSSYQENRSQCCFVNGHLSHTLPINCGVPQGSILGPLLFLLFINDLRNCFSSGLASMYADDKTVSFNADNTTTLEFLIKKDLESLDKWLKANKLSLSVKVTEFMLVTTRQKRQFIDEALSICIKNKPIKQVRSSKTLGLYIEETLSWSKHVEHILKKRLAPC